MFVKNTGFSKLMLLFLLLMMIFISGCGSQRQTVEGEEKTDTNADVATVGQTEAQQEISVTDYTGNTIVLSKPVERLTDFTGIILSFADLGIDNLDLFTFEGGMTRSLLEDKRFLGEKAGTVGGIRGSWFEPNLEDIIAAQPDVVLCTVYPHQALKDGLEGVSEIYFINESVSYLDALQDYRNIAKMTGRSEKAEKVIEEFLKFVDAAKAQVPKDKVVLQILGTDTNFQAYTELSKSGTLLNEVAIYPTINPAGSKENTINLSMEELLNIDPDVLFIQTIVRRGDEKPLSEQLAANPLWNNLKAVKNGTVYEVETKVWHLEYEPRVFTMILEDALPLIYPSVFR